MFQKLIKLFLDKTLNKKGKKQTTEDLTKKVITEIKKTPVDDVVEQEITGTPTIENKPKRKPKKTKNTDSDGNKS